MKRIIVLLVCLLCLILGIGLGAYVQYTSVTAKNYRRILKEYQYLRDNFQLTDAEMAEAGKKFPQWWEDAKRQEEWAARYALRAFRDLAKGDIDEAKADLLRPIGLYYRLYHDKGGDPDLLANIQASAKELPELAAEISSKPK